MTQRRSRSFCANSCLKSSLVFAVAFFSQSPNAGSKTSAASTSIAPSEFREAVIASVECRVKDPGNLKEYLGLEQGNLLKIETLNTYVSSLIVGDDILISGFPAVLNFNPRKKQFSFSGSTDSDEGSIVTLQIQGSMNQRSDAFFLFYLQDSNLEASGKATLNACRRIL